jgi:hypothetical protein
MKVDLKDGFLYILGVIIMALLYKIAYTKIYGKEGFVGEILNGIKGLFVNGVIKPIENGFKDKIIKPVESGFKSVTDPIVDTVNKIIDGVKYIIKCVTDMVVFMCYVKAVFIWLGNTVVCAFAVFNPFYCPIVRVIDMIIAFIGFVISTLLRLIPYFGDIVIGAFNKAVTGINDLSELLYGVRITDWHAMLGVSKKCYWCKFKPFPKMKK